MRQFDLNWEALNLQCFDLANLDEPFFEDEVLQAISQMPTDKAPEPNVAWAPFISMLAHHQV